ncbi:MAG: hypothetical protein ACLFUB_17765 [Cyclobacteriaceae bacterium]
MTTFIPYTHDLFTDKEGAVIHLVPESLQLNEVKVERCSEPISALKDRKFRRLFNRHQYTTR